MKKQASINKLSITIAMASLFAASCMPVYAKNMTKAVAVDQATVPSIARNPYDVPPSIGDRAPQLVKYAIETVEMEGRLSDGSSYTYWTFDKKVPGPFLRVREGDTVELSLTNNKSSKNIHSIDLHAVLGPGGGANNLQVAPGETKTVAFKATRPGLYVYHCATPLVPEHIASGMYGMILVEPAGGLKPVAHEFYVMQGEMYTKQGFDKKGHHDPSIQKLSNEQPDFYVFNGAVGSLTKEYHMTAKVGDTVRIYFGDGGPNKMSSFHVIGEIFDTLYNQASLEVPLKNVQTTIVPPGGATIAEFKMEYPGKYSLVDHAISRVGRGAVGILEVTGQADPSIYRASLSE